ncbi:MAG TPA: cation diffusion facilitator family transporter [Phenylobacterium sp.]|jgi:cation diffusion facilitator family transporter|uniref:cation diffusion facilitator family transporter n=1 Tax=Phenylobacterium sp. TaxID=1871053 RepID=UPI002D4E56F7|nr:cation diffusion facilitator family transporter [Phenylobacterium sp.]HZZ67997.1 cation diffusion facilitator family transporter [Phenylobacterium sp.]
MSRSASAAEPTCSHAALDGFQTDRAFLGADHRRNERRTWIVMGVCVVTLIAQVLGGLVFHSMALTASGLHMAAHVAALLVASGAYALARRHASNPAFAFGTGKIGFLAGFANAVVLGITAIAIAVESVQRLFSPETVDYGSALPLAVGGLAVTLVCVWLLKPTEHGRHDLNISAAHLHLSADAMVGVLAIGGLIAGQRLGWAWADPAAGLAGAALVAQFAVSLIRRASSALLDINPSPELTAEVRARLEADGERVVDLHLWRLGPGHNAAVAVVEAAAPQAPEAYHARLRGLEGLSHVTVEVRTAKLPGCP